jgi:hypothetical protein
MTAKHNPCPFCGVVTEVPHETQEGCIEALHKEIARVREILELVRDPRVDLRGQEPQP